MTVSALSPLGTPDVLHCDRSRKGQQIRGRRVHGHRRAICYKKPELSTHPTHPQTSRHSTESSDLNQEQFETDNKGMPLRALV